MELLEQDEQFLISKAINYRLVDEGEGGCLVIPAYPLSANKYDHGVVDLMVCIPKGYNDATLDNFYVDPAIRLKSSGQYPQNAEVFETHIERNWQRFSRHLPQWRPGIDSLQTFLPLIHRELQDKT